MPAPDNSRIEIVEETGSTNADLLARAESGGEWNEGDWLVADRQTEGRGRQGRAWLGAAGNFMGSTAVRLGEGDPPAASLSLTAGLAIYETVIARLAEPWRLQLKWPNDLLLGGVKIAGILLERSGDVVVVGVGVNLAAAPMLPDRATAHLAMTGPAPERDSFARDLAATFALELARWREGGLGALMPRWLAAAHPLGTELSVHGADGRSLTGRFAGLREDGALRLQTADGSTCVIHAGDVALV